MSQSTEFILIYVTSDSETEARTIAQKLVQENLAACVSVTPVTSVYRWDGAVTLDSEWQLTIKTRQERFAAIQAVIAATHSYDVPECIAVPIVAGTPSYLQWLRDSTEPSVNPA